jgi:small subunit ribosomal protein S20
MPRTKTAKKELRKNARRRERNIVKKKSLKKIIKAYENSLSSGTGAADLKIVYQALDKAAKSHVIKKNKASRLKSRLAKRAKKVK